MRVSESSQASQFDAQEARNAVWELGQVRGQYSYSNPHSDLYLYLDKWMPVDEFLNIGYTTPESRPNWLDTLLYLMDIVGFRRPGQIHLHKESQLRLVDLIADRLVELHEDSEYAQDNFLLDVGSGRGGPALHALQNYGMNVMGVDVTPFNVQAATNNAKRYGIDSNANFCAGDALNLPIPDASFTIGWSIESPAHFSDKRRFLREMGRVIKSGGVVAVADLLLNDNVEVSSKENRQIYESFLNTWDVPYLETFQSYKKALDDSGFELYESRVITENNLDIFHKYGELFLKLCKIHPLYAMYRSYLKKKKDANLDNVYDHIFASCKALRKHMIGYGVFWAVRR